MDVNEKILEVWEHISNNTVQLGQIIERVAERLDANDVALAKMIIDHEERMGKALQAIMDAAARTERMTSEVLTRLASVQVTSH